MTARRRPAAAPRCDHAGDLRGRARRPNPNHEFVELTLDPRFNSGNTTRHLTGYRLENRAGETFPLSSGFVIRDGQPVSIYSGRGVNGDAVPFWGRNSGAWDNFVGCIKLVSSSGGRYRIAVGSGCS